MDTEKLQNSNDFFVTLGNRNFSFAASVHAPTQKDLLCIRPPLHSITSFLNLMTSIDIFGYTILAQVFIPSHTIDL